MRACTHPERTAERLFPARDYVTGDGFEVAKCGRCGLFVTIPAPAGASMGRYYPPAYYGTSHPRRFPAVVERLQRVMYGQRARAVERLAGRVGRVLDVGCGRGFLLREFQRRGWLVQGTELSDAGARHAREVLGIPVHVGDETSWPWEPAEFDAALVWHVLEHAQDPRALLAAVQQVLRPGGVLLVSVPNFGSPEARLARDGWFHLDVPRHLTHFTPETLTAALGETGFSVEHTSFYAPEYDTFSFVQSALNRLPLPRNLLYDLLRARDAKLRGRRSAPAILATVAAAAPLMVAAPIATTLLGLAARGSTVVMYARKQG